MPAELVLLDQLPLNANLKVDRRALPLPPRPGQEAGGGAPVGAFGRGHRRHLGRGAERRRPRWAAPDNFFDLGGHSLIATKVRARLAEWLGFELPLRLPFRLAGSRRFRHRPARGAGGERRGPANGCGRSTARKAGAPLRRRLRRQPRRSRPCRPSCAAAACRSRFAQERMWVLDLWQPGGTAYHMPFIFDLAGELAPAALEAALRELLRRHPALRTTFGAEGGVPYQVVGPAAFDLEVRDLRALGSDDQEAAAEQLADQLMAPSTSPPARFSAPACCCWTTDAARLVLSFHHIVFDGWSAGIFFRELGCLLAGETLPEPALEYADYAAWQRNTFGGETAGPRAGVLAGPAGRRHADAGAAHRPAAHGQREPPRRRGARRLAGGHRSPAQGLRGRAQRPAFPGPDGGLPGAAAALLRPGGHPGRHPDRHPAAPRARAAGRPLPQHPGDPQPGRRRADLRAAFRSGAPRPCSRPPKTRTCLSKGCCSSCSPSAARSRRPFSR